MPDYLHILLRALGAIFMLFVIARILGKKQISQLTFFEYITGITLGELAGFISTDVENNYMHGVLALLVWFLVPLSMEYISLKNKTIRQLLEGSGRTVIRNGKVLEDQLKKEKYNISELMEQLRKKGAFSISEVEFAILETSGELNVLLKPEHLPLTPHHLGIKIYDTDLPQTVIEDGKIEDRHLSAAGRSREWLHTELEKQGVALENVFLGQLNENGELYVDLYDDQLTVQPAEPRKVLMAKLKKCQADLELFGLSTLDADAKRMYTKCAKQMEGILKSVAIQLTQQLR